MEVQSLNKFLLILFMCRSTETQRSSPCHRKCSYVEASQQANCEYRSLDTIPIECNAASYLSLRYNHITRIRPGVFRGFPFLKYLLLSNNNISHIEANTFIGAPQLKSIKLLNNNLQVFDRYALNGTGNRLRNIYLSRNSLRVIENGTFQLVPKLEVIDLYQNRLSQLTSGVFQHLKNLEHLFLGMNKLVNLPEDIFKDLSSLVYLELSNNYLTTLSSDLFAHMDYLMIIDLSRNRLVSIGNVLHLPNIRLDLRWNDLHQLDNLSLEVLSDNAEILFLKGNPWHCGCSMEPLRQWYQQLSISNEKDVKIDNPVCSYPSELANYTINFINVSLCVEIAVSSTETSKESVYNAEFGTNDIGTDQYVTTSYETGKTNTKSLSKIIPGVAVALVILVSIIIVICYVVFRKNNSGSPPQNPHRSTADSNNSKSDEVQFSLQDPNSLVFMGNGLSVLESSEDKTEPIEMTPLRNSSNSDNECPNKPQKDRTKQESRESTRRKLSF
ncbi:leucine-rich repeat-containing protein 15-like [Lytechinus pictus]|uniref:leucine-rich repeat-containing protein 15-like n=1 Tax=Lytechinus pictus TaxID=7653 RepID=UPI0030B9B596